MNAIKMLLAGLLSLLPMISACSPSSPPEKVTPVTHVAYVHLEPNQYPEFLSRLDAEMALVRLSRYGGKHPVLSDLHGRDVLDFDYRFQVSDMGFIGAQDIVKHGVIEIYIYADYIKDEKVRAEAFTRLEAALNAFGTKLEIRTEKNFGPKMDLSVYGVKKPGSP